MNFSPLKGDTIRKKGSYRFRYVISLFFTDRTYRPMVTFRMCQATRRSKYLGKIVHYFFRFMHRWACSRAGIELPWKTRIGVGFALTHGWGTIINTNATIGKNVTFFNGVVLGQRDRISKDGKRTTEYPVIEDEVWVGPHAIIVGGVTIGKGSRIAGGSFVTESIPPYSTVMGNPASIVKTGSHPDVPNPAP
jgi:serine O-acetyltransferase